MAEKTSKEMLQDPVALAQNILDQLKEQEIEPTPEAFQRLYNELTGAPTLIETEGVLPQIARRLARSNTDAGLVLATKIESREWRSFGDEIINLIGGGTSSTQNNAPGNTIQTKGVAHDMDRSPIWRDLLERTLKHTVPDLLRANLDLALRAENLSADVKFAKSKYEVDAVSKEIKDLYFRIHQYSDDFESKQHSFTRLLYRMIGSIKESINPRNPIVGEIEAFQRLLNDPLDQRRMSQAISHLKEAIFKNRI